MFGLWVTKMVVTALARSRNALDDSPIDKGVVKVVLGLINQQRTFALDE